MVPEEADGALSPLGEQPGSGGATAAGDRVRNLNAASGAQPPLLTRVGVQRLCGRFERAADGVLITDRFGSIREGNSVAARILGLEPRFLAGKPLPLYVRREQRSTFRWEIAQAVADSAERTWQLDLQPRQGPLLRLVLTAVPFTSEEEQAIHLLWALHEVGDAEHTDLRFGVPLSARAPAAADRAAERQEALAEISAVLGSSLDLETTLARAARLALPLLGDWAAVYLLDEAGNTGRTMLAHTISEREAEIAALWEQYPLRLNSSEPLRLALESGRTQVQNAIPDPEPGEHHDRLAQMPYWRSLRAHAVICAPLRTRGRTLGAIAFISEEHGKRYDRADVALAEEVGHRAAIAIENARLYAETQRAVRMRDEFLASISHDLRSPLATVKGSAQLIARRLGQRPAEDGDAAFARQLAQGITNAASTMAEMIDQLLDLARQDAHQPLALDLQETDLASLARAALESAQATAGATRLAVELPRTPLVGRWDALRLRRMLDNLIGNALKYGAGSAVHVRLQRERTAAGDEAVLSVTDGGVGIPAADLPRIFERFHRGSNVVGTIPGTGIGLAGARQIVERHGGRIAIESSEGEGTTVTVRLPIAPPAPPPR